MSTIFDKKGIQLASAFDLQSNMPLDSRFVVDTLAHLNAYLDNVTGCAYLGMQVFCEENNTVYVLKGQAADKSTWHWEIPSAQITSMQIIETEIEEE